VTAVGAGPAVDRDILRRVHVGFRDPALVRKRRDVEGPRPGRKSRGAGMSIAELQSGKGHKDENFPVASFLIAPRHRPPVLAFYRFARTADDVADHVQIGAPEKLELLEGMRATLAGESDADAPSLALRQVLAGRGVAAQ